MVVETCRRHYENKQYVVDASNQLIVCRDVIHRVLKIGFVTFKKSFNIVKQKLYYCVFRNEF